MKPLNRNLKIAAVVLTLTGLASCSQNSKLSINKRHYRSGYEITWTGKKSMTPAPAKTYTEVTQPVSMLNVSLDETSTEANCIQTYTPETFVNFTEPTVNKSKIQKTAELNPVFNKTSINSEINSNNIHRAADDKIIPVAEQKKEGFIKKIFRGGSDLPKWAEIILCIILPPLPVGLKFGIGSEFWISLLLTLLFWIPGVIYALIICNK